MQRNGWFTITSVAHDTTCAERFGSGMTILRSLLNASNRKGVSTDFAAHVDGNSFTQRELHAAIQVQDQRNIECKRGKHSCPFRQWRALAQASACSNARSGKR